MFSLDGRETSEKVVLFVGDFDGALRSARSIVV